MRYSIPHDDLVHLEKHRDEARRYRNSASMAISGEQARREEELKKPSAYTGSGMRRASFALIISTIALAFYHSGVGA